MKTNWGLVNHVKMALEESWGYVYGTFGQILTPPLLDYKLTQYSDQITKYIEYIRENYLGKRTVDCIGLIKSYLWWNDGRVLYDSETDTSANKTFLELAKEKGSIDTIPDLPGVCVWKNNHVGVYIGNGTVIEAKGTLYGVVQSDLKNGSWAHWFKYPYIDYEPYVDHEQISSWAKEAINYLKESGVMQGSGYKFRPKDFMTREEVAVAINRAIEKALSNQR